MDHVIGLDKREESVDSGQRRARIIPVPKRRRLRVIFNPVAGPRSRQRLRDVMDCLERLGCTYALAETTGPGDAEQLAAECSAERFDVIVAAGGDGTINEVINGLGPQSPPMAILPLGTANVFALEINLPGNPAGIANVIATGEPRRLYTGRANHRRFIQMAGVGFDAHVVANIHPSLKKHFGKLAYAYQTLSCWLHYRPTTLRIRGEGIDCQAASAIISNGRYYGGRFRLNPEASVWNEGLYICVFEYAGRWHALRYLVAIALSRLGKLPDVQHYRISRVRVEGSVGEPVQADGDIVGETPIVIESENEPLMVLAP